jgi:tRNA (guanine26-N2/guanine27-N2)-dimethyltransferase
LKVADDVNTNPNKVFYNPVQEFNRDLSILAIKSYSEQKLSVLEPLAATGLRAIRYIQEIPQIEHVTLNDLSEEAT